MRNEATVVRTVSGHGPGHSSSARLVFAAQSLCVSLQHSSLCNALRAKPLARGKFNQREGSARQLPFKFSSAALQPIPVSSAATGRYPVFDLNELIPGRGCVQCASALWSTLKRFKAALWIACAYTHRVHLTKTRRKRPWRPPNTARVQALERKTLASAR